MEKNQTVGRRKASIARVTLAKGSGEIRINDKTLQDYFPVVYMQNKVLEPFQYTETVGQYDIKVNVQGGGVKGQSEAVRLGISRALVVENEEFRAKLKVHKLLTRDARVVERKKPGLRKARKKEQYSKR